MDDDVSVSLKRDLALVLYDWLARTSAAGRPVEVADQAEQRALWDLESALESILPETLQEGYAERVARARHRVRDQGA
ncbi:hypothetical protein [Cellulomonas sp. SLBN-39]|uniref:hypothetical protein n=1 Tax=Cellulomonas sp. SLBN-39 TaxID=2768446 RepID=UPI00116FF4AD|nr:hypothetical protein [Cellulomonas sp. SLBN-39]TQL02731.1 hypothetical protein FBY24_1812 [Cellulomonas sp. SLBN-39]